MQYWNTAATVMLENNDDLALLDPTGNIVDYLAWGADPGADDDMAVSQGHWQSGAFVDTASFAENETLGRNRNSTDTDTSADWENATTSAGAPYGINGTEPSPGRQNIPIPEFSDIAFGLILIAVIVIFTALNKKNKKKKTK
jgi:hypothetical protein